jgi:hypothetical protein
MRCQGRKYNASVSLNRFLKIGYPWAFRTADCNWGSVNRYPSMFHSSAEHAGLC